MRILFIAPVPPPLTGNSLAVKILVDEISKHHEVELINQNKSSLKSGINSLSRIKKIISILYSAFCHRNNADVIYLSLSESLAGNLKDIVLYIILRGKLSAMLVHLLGGSGIKAMMEANGLRSKVNTAFYRRLAGVIVEGRTQAGIFANSVSPRKIHVVPNFAEDFLFLSENDIRMKFLCVSPLKILFLSNLINGKGHNELVDAYVGLDSCLQSAIRIAFVGGFEGSKQKGAFLKRIENHKNITYLGSFIGGNDKRELYSQSHIFCLPTYYPYEGQPISILEAYATGCVVIATDHGGIRDVFRNAVNGYVVQKKSAESIRRTLIDILRVKPDLLSMALYNRKISFEKYRTNIYAQSIKRILENGRNSLVENKPRVPVA